MDEEKYYYNLATKQVEQGKVADMSTRMGPYDTRAEAESALSLAEQRNEAWEQDEKRWNQD